MRISDMVVCNDFPCVEARQTNYSIPSIAIDPESIKLILISETAPGEAKDHYYSGEDGMFARTTLQAFREAGVRVSSIDELTHKGVYLTTAVKCGKHEYAVATSTIARCSNLLERELSFFPNVKAFLLMGDVAIKAMNTVSKRQGGGKVIPAGSTYKIRGGDFYYRGRRAFPSYLQAGPSYGIEKSKQRMIAEDIAAAVSVAGIN